MDQQSGQAGQDEGPRQVRSGSDISIGTRGGEAAYRYGKKTAESAWPWIRWALWSPVVAFWNLPPSDKFAFGLLLTTIIYATITNRQLHVLKTQVRDARKAAEESAESAKADRELAAKAHEAAARAWIVSGDELTISCPEIGKPMSINYHLVNSGSRPAIRVRSHSAARVWDVGPDYGFPSEPPYRDERELARIQAPSVSVIGPGQKQHDTVTSYPIKPDEFSGFPRYTHTLFVYGKITYEDGFGITRHTRWCRRWLPSPDNRCVSRFVWCSTYNDAD